MWKSFSSRKDTATWRWSATVRTTAHLIPKDSTYPARVGEIRVTYDYLSRRVSAVGQLGYEANRTYVRLYDRKQEYLVWRGEYPSCERSHLGEPMPMPALPAQLADTGHVDEIDGVPHERWLDATQLPERVIVWLHAGTHLPRRLTTTWEEGGAEKPLMTYDLLDLVAGPEDADVPPAFAEALELPTEHTHDTCKRHVGGWPYLHVFHHYVRF